MRTSTLIRLLCRCQIKDRLHTIIAVTDASMIYREKAPKLILFYLTISKDIHVGGDLRRVWGDGNFFADQDFRMTFFREQFPFSRQNFWWPFLVIDYVFHSFPIVSHIFHVFTVCNVIYDPFFTRKPYFLDHTFFTLFVLSLASDKHYFSKCWGDGCMGRPLPPTVRPWVKTHRPTINSEAYSLPSSAVR